MQSFNHQYENEANIYLLGWQLLYAPYFSVLEHVLRTAQPVLFNLMSPLSTTVLFAIK